jgi:competence protein ComEA
MKTGKVINSWTITIFLLLAVIIAGSVVIWLKNNRDRGIEITIKPAMEIEGKIWVGGAVNNPGLYPFFKGDGIDEIVRAAGGIQDGADLNAVKLTIAGEDEEVALQKVNINTAESWLLEALPGIGEIKAEAIIEYRRQHGPFRDIYELEKVPGLGGENFKQVAGLITVNE